MALKTAVVWKAWLEGASGVEWEAWLEGASGEW